MRMRSRPDIDAAGETPTRSIIIGLITIVVMRRRPEDSNGVMRLLALTTSPQKSRVGRDDTLIAG
jgi:hypothetical protein